MGITDFITKILESIAFSISDVLGDRVKRFARYQRKIIEERLRDYNSIDAFANTVYKYLDSESHNTALEDIKIALPGWKNDKKRLIMLFTSNRIIIVDYEDYRFIPIYQIHFSECKLFCDSVIFKTEKLDKLSIIGKKLGFLTEGNSRYLYIYFDTIHKKWWRCGEKSVSMKIKLDDFPNDSVIAKRYDEMIKEICEINTDNIISIK